ncbi:YdcF family protein [Larkinella terrae]|uniref:YdcF family protein n=1 Tax=Larkinella terrae TaxID=2025311 RepID=A0A7K0EW12_9BACT|nr:YdcF family protein [Larkinella terrae]MRS65756.1 YdcF family protein [Larkinella terrae]
MTNQISADIHALAKKLWNYHQLHQPLQPADAILVLCSYDKRVAERGAQLWLEGWAPVLIFSGGLGVITRTMWSEPEADQFARIAVEMGVPASAIIVENRSTNTGENVLFTRQLLTDRNLDPARFILVQKPYMERRSFATFRKLWPEKPVSVTSPQTSYEEYLDQYSNPDLSQEQVINIMVGDLQRIREYPQKGFQIPQEIPPAVWEAYEALIKAGYTKHLIKD